MRITHLSLTNFRNYARLELPIPSGVIVLYGDNAQGKTSLLESVYYLATSKSPYTQSDRQLINWLVEDDPLPFARLVGEVRKGDLINRVESTLLLDKSGRFPRFKKEVRINGAAKRVMDLLGQMRVVLFLPRDVSLVEGTPSDRRRYLDITLCQVDTDYCRSLNRYNKVLGQRNALLKQFQERRGAVDEEQIAYWDEQLAGHGGVIVAGRYKLIRELERRAQTIHSDLSGADEFLRLRYIPGFDATDDAGSGQMSFGVDTLGASTLPQLPPREIAARFIEALKAARRDDLSRGATTIGPQRDEMRFLVNGRDLGDYGSRGQNRTAVLALKLAELGWMHDQTDEWPVLLLDEVAAELDPRRRSYLFDAILQAEQVIITTAEPYLLDDEALNGATAWRVQAGTIQQDNSID